MKMNLKTICLSSLKTIAFAIMMLFVGQNASAQATLADLKLDATRLMAEATVLQVYAGAQGSATEGKLYQIKQAYVLSPTTYNLARLKFYSNVIEAVSQGTTLHNAILGNFVFVNPANGVTTPNALTMSKAEQQTLADEITSLAGFYQ